MRGRVPRLRLTLRTARIVGEAIAVVITVVAGLIGGPTGLRLRPRSVARIRPARWTALSRLPTERLTGRRFASAPLESNYDPCADLSTVLVTIEGATGSSPIQALMFHRGEFWDRHMEGLRLHIVGYSGIHPRHGGASLPVGSELHSVRRRQRHNGAIPLGRHTSRDARSATTRVVRSAVSVAVSGRRHVGMSDATRLSRFMPVCTDRALKVHHRAESG